MCMEKHCKFVVGQKRRNQTMAQEEKIQIATEVVLSPEARTNFAGIARRTIMTSLNATS